MRHILCESCGQDKKLVTGERLALAATEEEPAEYERIVWGRANVPDPRQRVMYINDAPFPLPLGEYTCDLCSAPIHPGDRCCTQTVWLEDGRIAAWEHEFLTPDVKET